MYDTTPFQHPDCLVPVAQIEETRRAFPGAALTFDVLIHAPDPLAGLGHVAAVLSRAGLELQMLRCAGSGRIAARLRDRGTADLGCVAQELSGPVARVESWTTVIAPATAAS